MSVSRKTTLDKLFVVARWLEKGKSIDLTITALEQIISDLEEVAQKEIEDIEIPDKTGDPACEDKAGCSKTR